MFFIGFVLWLVRVDWSRTDLKSRFGDWKHLGTDGFQILASLESQSEMRKCENVILSTNLSRKLTRSYGLNGSYIARDPGTQPST